MMVLWVTATRAQEMGCTHRARFLGLVPGFFNPDTALWVSRSDLLAPIEALLSFLWVAACQVNGEDPCFMFELGAEL